MRFHVDMLMKNLSSFFQRFGENLKNIKQGSSEEALMLLTTNLYSGYMVKKSKILKIYKAQLQMV